MWREVQNYSDGSTLLDLDMKLSTILVFAVVYLVVMWIIGFLGAYCRRGRIFIRNGYKKDQFVMTSAAWIFAVCMWFITLRPMMRTIGKLFSVDITDSKMMLFALIATILIWSAYGLLAYCMSLFGLQVKKELLGNKVEKYSVSHECYNHDTHIEC